MFRSSNVSCGVLAVGLTLGAVAQAADTITNTQTNTQTISNSQIQGNSNINTQTNTFTNTITESHTYTDTCSNIWSNAQNGTPGFTVEPCTTKGTHDATVVEESRYSIASYLDSVPACAGAARITPACAPKKFKLERIAGLSFPRALNNHGVVVGSVGPGVTSDGAYHAGTWNSGNLVDLGVIGCRLSTSLCRSMGYGINDQGVVAGESHVLDPYQWYLAAYYSHPAIWKNAAGEYVPNVGAEWGVATNVNNVGSLVGYARSTAWTTYAGDYEEHGFVKVGDAVAEIGTYGQSSQAWAINDHNQVTGHVRQNQETRAFFWESGVTTVLGHLGGHYSTGKDISGGANVHVVGNSLTNGGLSRGFVWSHGEMLDLGSLTANGSSMAAAINGNGQVVGNANGQAVVWQNGNVYELANFVDNLGSITLLGALDVNDRGQILVTGYSGGGYYIYFGNYLLTPIP